MPNDGFPPLPKGFQAPVEAPAPEAPASNDNADNGGFPTLPQGFDAPQEQQAPVEATEEAPQQMPRKDFDKELVARIKRGDSKQDILDFTANAGYGTIPNIDDVIEGRKKKLRMTSKVVHNDDEPSFHVRVGKVLKNMSEGGALPAVAAGVLRAPVRIAEGLGQIESRVKGAMTGEEGDARLEQFALNQESENIDKDIQNSGYGGFATAGEIGADLAATWKLPLAAVQKYGKLANIGATVAKRAAIGGGIAAVDGAKATPEDQDMAIVTGALLTPAMIPVTEKIFTKLGAKLGNAFSSVLSSGVGKTIYDASGSLTAYGKVLRARLKSINRDLPDELIDDGLKGIAAINPKVMPQDSAVINEGLAANEKVPLTGAMKARDAKGIQDFESLKTGSIGSKSAQDQALARDSDIDTAITDNIKSIGSGATSADANANIGIKATQAYDNAAANVDKLYEPLNRTMIRDVKKVGEIASNARAKFGKGSYSTLGAPARGYLDRVSALTDDGTPISFGELWKLSKDVNRDLRTATSNDRYQLGIIKQSIDKYFSDMATSGTGISKAAAEQLKIANGANRQFSRTFGQNDVKLRAGGTAVTDQAGKAVQKIIGLTKDAAERGEQINPAQIETAIFGNAKALDSAGAKQAAITVQRLTKAVPDLAPHVKDVTLNRIVSQMEEGLYDKSVKVGKTQSVIRQAVENNRPLLKAAGFTDKDITRLQTNAYLASLKVPPSGAAARGSSATNRGVAKKIAIAAFRRTLALALGAAGAHEGGTFAGILAYGAGEAALGAAEAANAARLARRTLSSKVPLRPSPAGMRAGKKLGTVVGAQTMFSNPNGD